MDDEHERQRRDLQRATGLLQTMTREEMAEMLLDILLNERSDDTRKLSDWMAFQIILHDDTRRERELLAQLGKVSYNQLRVTLGCTQPVLGPRLLWSPFEETEVTLDLRTDYC